MEIGGRMTTHNPYFPTGGQKEYGTILLQNEMTFRN
jgi:hypothetical protein